MLTPRQAAEKIGLSVSLIYQLCKSGSLQHLRVGSPGRRGRILIDPHSFDQFLESCRARPIAPVPLRHIKM